MLVLFAMENSFFQLFENNFLNWLVLILLLAYFWFRITPALFSMRKDKIETILKEAEEAKQESHKLLRAQQEKIASAEQVAESILVEAKKIASQMQSQVQEQCHQEAESLRQRIEQQITLERQLAITEMRSQAATAAVRLAEATLSGAVTTSAKNRLFNQFVEQLDTLSSKKQKK